MKISKFQAVQMGSEYFGLVRAAATEQRAALATDFRRRAETIKNALELHGWRILSDGINVERIRR